MSNGSQGRRTVRGVALIVLPIALLALSGCAQIPIPRANMAPIHLPPPAASSSAVVPTATQAVDVRELLPPLPSPVGAASEPSPPVPEFALRDEAVTLAGFEEPKPIAGDDPASAVAPPESAAPENDHDPARSDETVASPEPEPKPQRPGPALASAAESNPEPIAAALNALVPGDKKNPPKPLSIDPEKPAAVRTSRELWDEGLERLRKLAREQGKSSGSTATWPLRARVLEAINQLDREEADGGKPLWTSVLTALAATQGSPAADERARATEIRAAVAALEDEAPLEIIDLRLCRKVKGFGNYDPIDPTACKPGQPLIVYCEMSGLRYRAAGEMCHSRLSAHVELAAARGGETAWAHDLGAAEDVCRRRRRDYYVNYRIVLPDTLPPGDYLLHLTQNDEIARRSTVSTVPLTIRP